ncbi:MAG: efflux transporter periplasmic adaptor subunit, partial [Paracoccaceae bacterium]
LVAQGYIARDSAAVGDGLTGRLVFAALDQARGLKPGDFVTVEIDEAPLRDVIVLPAGALGSDGTVLALGADDRLETVAVELLRRQGDDILLRAPDLAGREVVRARTPLLGAGIKVRPLRVETGEVVQAEEPERIDLSPERRARLKAFVEASERMPADVKTRLLSELEQPQVRAQMVARLEARMGG